MNEAAQSNQILKHMRNGRSLTALEALKLFGCARLGARVFELKNEDGHAVLDRWIKTRSGKRVKEYYLDDAELSPAGRKYRKASHHAKPTK